ncbi:MAG: hypothetical protein AB7J13_09375, partial [Pyrinomonadaceae bacterium]
MFLVVSVVSKGRRVYRFVSASAAILSLLVCSLLAPANAGATVVAMVSTNLAGTMAGGTSDWRSIVTLASYLGPETFFMLATDGAKRLAGKRSRQIDRIVIKPGNRSVLRGETVNFLAVAYSGDEPVQGTRFEWSIVPREGGEEVRLLSSVFQARRAGEFVVRASAGGRQGQATLSIRVDSDYAAGAPIRKPENERTEAERAQIARWRAEGSLIERSYDSRNIYPVINPTEMGGERSLAAEQTKGGPSDPTDAELNEATNSTATPFFLAEPLLWDSGNWSVADDRANWVGRPIGAAKDARAGNGNFLLSAPAVSLPGRGIDINLNLNYNSRVWSIAGGGMLFNADSGYPAPGWSLGFGKMYYLGATAGCILVEPDGTRRPSVGTSAQYGLNYSHRSRTTDGSFINYACSKYLGGSLEGKALYPNGTTIEFARGRDGNQMFPYRITDRHGNYILISYVNSQGPEIDTISDTLGRTITFNYASGRLINITGPGYNGTTRTFLRLHYTQKTLSYNFGSMGTTVSNGSPYMIQSIYYPTTNDGYWFGDSDSYSTYGMIAKVISQRGMSSSGTSSTEGSATGGTMSTQDVYNYPMDATGGALSDAPTYTTLTQTWDSTDTSPAVTTYAKTTSGGDEVMTVTLPNGSKSKQTSEINPGFYDDGMWFKTEIQNSSSVTLDTTEIQMAQGDYSSMRPTQIVHTDEKSQVQKTEFTYGSYFNQVASQKEYNYGASSPTLYREKRYTYENGAAYISPTNYPSSTHIFNLVKTEEEYDGAGNRLTRTEYTYDGATLLQTTGMTHHLYWYDPYTTETVNGDYCEIWSHNGCTYEGQKIEPNIECWCEQWEQVSAFNSATAYRGNLTSVTTYDTVTSSTLSGAITHDYTYDILGNQRTATTNCCQQISTDYSTSTQFSQPDSVTRGSSNPSSPEDRITESYSYDSNTKVPTTVTDSNGDSTTIGYDAVSRPTLITLNSGGKKTITYNDSSLNRTELVQKSSGEGSGTVSNSTVYTNGRGQPIKTTYQAGASTHKATQIQYDVMGRLG